MNSFDNSVSVKTFEMLATSDMTINFKLFSLVEGINFIFGKKIKHNDYHSTQKSSSIK